MTDQSPAKTSATDGPPESAPSGAIPRDLPIVEALPSVLAGLAEGRNLVLEAPPGAGKTTAVPLALLDAPWAAGRAIVMLEPRRLATRAAAGRIAALLGEPIGRTVGYRMRSDTRVGPATRIEIVTDGVFTRMIADDPALDRFAAVLFDEVHERRLDSDLGLAFALESQAALRPDLRLVAMSATLDGAALSRLMDARIVSAAGRAFPVERRHLEPPSDRIEHGVADAVMRALESGPGGILVFLPGAAEIRRVERLLRGRLPAEADLMVLHGDLMAATQDQALRPSPEGRRKVVLSTAIAETSLTLPDIRHVVDSGLARMSLYDPRSGMTRLDTVKVSRAGAEQRAGRAGRTAPGIVWRLWPESLHNALPERAAPEIATTDLAPLALDLAIWGTDDPAHLKLLDPPPAAALTAARALLADLGALDAHGRVTPHGRLISRSGLHPRLGHMVLRAADAGDGSLAALIAALLSERDILRGGDRDSDFRSRIEMAMSGRPSDDAVRRVRDQAKRIERRLGIDPSDIRPAHAGAVLALAYPDRVAMRRAGGRFLLSGGRGAFLPDADPLAAEKFLTVADLDGQKPDARIWLAAPVAREDIEAILQDRIQNLESVAFDRGTGSVTARHERRLGALTLATAPWPDPPPDKVGSALLAGIREAGLAVLPWTEGARSLQARIRFVAACDGPDAGWPDLADEALARSLEQWLGPHLDNARGFSDLARVDLATCLGGMFTFAQRQDLDRQAPARMTVPSGASLAIDYAGDVPTLSVRVQALFGLKTHPAVFDGRVPLLLSLLSPADRPIQLTRDLPGFWAGSWKAVRAELRGRYPKHAWPEDPATASPPQRKR